MFYNSSKNQKNNNNQSAGNSVEKLRIRRSSETKRALSLKDQQWLAGVIDGDGNFDFKKNSNGFKVLKSIRIVQHIRDARILYHIKDLLKVGSIKPKGKNLLIYRLCNLDGFCLFLNNINGHVRLRYDSFILACHFCNIKAIQPSFVVEKDSAYLAGLIDTDGSFVYNHIGNRIDLLLEFKQTKYSLLLDLTHVIEGSFLCTYKFNKTNQNVNKIFYSIRFVYARIDNMLLIYNYIKKNRLYSDFKFYRAMSIKRFLEIRPYNKYSKNTLEYSLFKKFIIDFFSYKNQHKPLPDWLLQKGK